MNTIPMTDEQVYLFDLQGFIVLKDVVPAEMREAALEDLDRFEKMDPSDYPATVLQHGERTEARFYISNILEAGPAFVPFMDIPEVLGVIARVTGSRYRLNHAYTIYAWKDGYTQLHMANTPLRGSCQYRCENGMMFSALTKAVFPLTDSGPEDGCFACIPGSHKSNFPRPWGDHPDENPSLQPVIADPGDAIIFTEALTHGSLVNRSGRPRQTLFYCYSVNWMPCWSSEHFFSDNVGDGLNDEQKKLVALRSGSGRDYI